MSAAHSIPPDTNQDSHSHARAWDILAAMPQASAVRKSHAQAWLDYVVANDPERAEWHAARATGIGGSEAGAVLAWYTGEIKARKGVESLVKDKLLLRTPERPNADMMRGITLEDHICQVFEARLNKEGRQWKRRKDLETRVNHSVPNAYPWMRANVDAIYAIDGAMVIVDFKAPSENSLKDQLRTEGNDEYKAQLNHYAIVAESAGLAPKALWLVLYDYARVATDGVQIIDVAIDPAMQQSLVEASGELWNNWIIKGQVPTSSFKEEVVPVTPPPAEVSEAATRAARAKLLAEAAIKEYEANRIIVSDWVREQGQLGELPMFLGPVEVEGNGLLKVTASRELDVDASIERLYDIGRDDTYIDELKVPGKYKDAGVLANRYDDLRSLCLGLLDAALKNEIPEPAQLAKIAKQLDKTPARHPDAFDAEKIRTALVSCGEAPHDYESEVVSAVVDRRDRDDKAKALAYSEDAVASFLSSVPEQEPTSDFMESVRSANF